MSIRVQESIASLQMASPAQTIVRMCNHVASLLAKTEKSLFAQHWKY
jgi:hypothetical protein